MNHAGWASASVCDASGRLLFYGVSDSVARTGVAGSLSAVGYVRNRLHQVMPNGSGILGNASGDSYDGVVILPFINDTSKYYLFVTDEVFKGAPSPPPRYPMYLRYSVVDMQLDNGLGDVVPHQKNIILDSFTYDMIFAVRGAGCYDWLLVYRRDLNGLNAYKIDANGIHFPPVYSPLTPGLHFGFRASPDTRTIAGFVRDGIGIQTRTDLTLHRFDNQTGTVSGMVRIDSVIQDLSTWLDTVVIHTSGMYLEFSPDNKKLYATARNSTSPPLLRYHEILQFDISNPQDIHRVKSTHYQVARSAQPADGFSELRRGPDGKIYVASFSGSSSWQWTIALIAAPDSSGAACSFNPRFLDARVGADLGNYVIERKAATQYIRYDTSVCFPSSVTLQAPRGYERYLWDDGSLDTAVAISGPSVRWVKSSASCDRVTRVDTFHVSAIRPDTSVFTTDTIICFDLSAGLTVSEYVGSGVWDNGDTARIRRVQQDTTVWFLQRAGCRMRIDTFNVQLVSFAVDLGADTILCAGDSIILDASVPSPGTRYLWQDQGTDPVCTASKPGLYTVLLEQDGCRISDTLIISPPDTLVHITDTSVCFDQPVRFHAPDGYGSYYWNDGISEKTNTFSGPADKWVVSANSCTDARIDSFRISQIIRDTLYAHTDTVVCFKKSLMLAAPEGYRSYVWKSGETTRVVYTSAPDTTYVWADMDCRSLYKRFDVRNVNFELDLGPDIVTCKDTVIHFNAPRLAGAGYAWQDGSDAAGYEARAPGVYTISVRMGPCIRQDTVVVRYAGIRFGLGPDRGICKGAQLLLDATSEGASHYLWQDGYDGAVFTANEPGLYHVQAYNEYCAEEDTVVISRDYCDCNVFVPDAFTPNSDGRNDLFTISIDCPVSDYQVMIYNRYGQQVFSGADPTAGWNGHYQNVPAKADTYFYWLRFKDVNGKKHLHKGDLLLIR